MERKRFGILLLLAAVFLWGPAPVITKLALLEVPQFSLAFLRAVISTAIVFTLFYKKGYFKVEKRDLKKIIAAGLLGSVFNLSFFFLGIQRTSAISAQTIFTTNPLIIAVLAHVILKEKIGRIQFLGVFVGLLGATMVALRDIFENGNFQSGSLLGNFLILLAALSWVGYILLSKSLSHRYSPITITSFSFLVSLFAFTPLAVWENWEKFNWIANLGFNGIFGIVYQGIFASVLAFLAYQTGLKLTSAFASGVILYLNPVVTTLVAVPVLGEKITPVFLIGATLIIVGSAVATQFEVVKHHVKKRLNLKKIFNISRR